MARWLKLGLVQAAHPLEDRAAPPAVHHTAALTRHQQSIADAAAQGVQVLCLPALCTGPYLGYETDPRWRELAEPLGDGPTARALSPLARRHDMVLVVPLYERDEVLGSFHAVAVIDGDGRMLGATRQVHVPAAEPHAWERTFFQGGSQPPAVWRTRHAVLGVLPGHDRHFADLARHLGRLGAELVVAPAAAAGALAAELWQVEGPGHAARHGYYLAALNRVEPPCFGGSYVADPAGLLVARAAEAPLLVTELDLDRVGAAATVSRV